MTRETLDRCIAWIADAAVDAETDALGVAAIDLLRTVKEAKPLALRFEVEAWAERWGKALPPSKEEEFQMHIDQCDYSLAEGNRDSAMRSLSAAGRMANG